MPEKSKTTTCGSCGVIFKTDEEYLVHKCVKTGFTPRDIEHFDKLSGGKYSLVSKAALKRGEEKRKK